MAELKVRLSWASDLTVNHYRMGRAGGYRRKGHVQQWMQLAQDEVAVAHHMHRVRYAQRALTPPLRILVTFRWPDRRERDDHNWYKALVDAIAKGMGLVKRDGTADDSQVSIQTVGQMVVGSQEAAGFDVVIQEVRDD